MEFCGSDTMVFASRAVVFRGFRKSVRPAGVRPADGALKASRSLVCAIAARVCSVRGVIAACCAGHVGGKRASRRG